MKSVFKLATVLFIAAFALSACNTVRGMGKDIEKGGEAIQKSTN